MEKIEQAHREIAALKIECNTPKGRIVREKILSGKADDHPSVQAAAFYKGIEK